MSRMRVLHATKFYPPVRGGMETVVADLCNGTADLCLIEFGRLKSGETVLVQAGASVAEEDELLILESMKMEIPVPAPHAGTVQQIHISAGDTVQENDLLLTLA